MAAGYRPRQVCPVCLDVGRLVAYSRTVVLPSGREVTLTSQEPFRPLHARLDCDTCQNTGWSPGP